MRCALIWDDDNVLIDEFGNYVLIALKKNCCAVFEQQFFSFTAHPLREININSNHRNDNAYANRHQISVRRNVHFFAVR